MYYKLGVIFDYCFFFFSSRRRHTRFDCDWSSDVCSSDLGSTGKPKGVMIEHRNVASFLRAMDERLTYSPGCTWLAVTSPSFDISVLEVFRSEERRVGKECRSRWSPYH